MSNAVDFRKLALDLRGKLTAAQSELAALREELAESGRADHLRQRIAFLTTEVHARADERDDLQQRLTAAEQRNVELEKELAESGRKRREFVEAVKVETDRLELLLSQRVVVPEGYAVVPIKPNKAMRDACRIAGKLPVWDDMIAAALKPTESGASE